MSNQDGKSEKVIVTDEKNIPYWEKLTVEKFHNGDRIKFMSFSVKLSEKSKLTQMVMDLLITITLKEGYKSYFDSNVVDPLASLTAYVPTPPADSREGEDNSLIASRIPYPQEGEEEAAKDWDLNKLYQWLMDENKRPAQTAFTAGITRNIAKEIEYRLAGATWQSSQSTEVRIEYYMREGLMPNNEWKLIDKDWYDRIRPDYRKMVSVPVAASQQTEGCRWVKASERVPEIYEGIVFHCKANGLATCCYFDGSYFYDMETEYRGEDSVQWLDESSLPQPGQEAVAFAEWKDSRYATININGTNMYYSLKDEKENKVPSPMFSIRDLHTLFTSQNQKK